MAKDPAFLFYASDFLTGTMFMSNEQVGKYIRLLCSQHQHGGIIEKDSFDNLVGSDALLKKKFIECEDGFYNERLADEMNNRCKKSSNISQAAKETWEKRKKSIQKNTIVSQSYNDSITIAIRTEDEDESVLNKKEELKFPFKSEQFLKAWQLLVKSKKWKKKEFSALQMSLKKLSKYPEPVAVKMIEDCIAGEWQGFVEPKEFKKEEIDNRPKMKTFTT